MISDNKKQLNEFINQLYQRKRNGVLKNRKAYDRARDRKDKRLYEFEKEVSNDIKQESPQLL